MELEKEKILDLLLDEQNEKALFEQADEVQWENVTRKMYGLIEFSNVCRNNCCYCGLRRDNKQLNRYRMEPEGLIKTVRKAVANDLKYLVLQSGEDVCYTKDVFAHIIREIKKFGVSVTLSVGERTYDEYKAWREAGADGYLMRIETTDQDLYHRLDPGMSWKHRYECLLMLKELGYELGSGIMVGLPGQTIESIADDLLFLKELGVRLSGIGPFIPHPQTPLANEKGGTLKLALRTMAVQRLLMPDIDIPATTAMEVLHPDGRKMALQSGANLFMVNVTGECRKLYDLYPGKTRIK